MQITDQIRNIMNRCNKGLEGTERVIEVPFLFESLPEPSNQKVLDIGCCESDLVVHLNSIGFDVYGIDMRDCKQRNNNITDNIKQKFIIGDVRKMEFQDNIFDIVYAISTLEHVGLVETPYHTDTIFDEDGDIKALIEMMRVTKPGGKIIFTVPYGIGENGLKIWQRFYTKDRIQKMIEKTGIVVDKFTYKVHCIDTEKGIHIWPEVDEKLASERASIWIDNHGAFMASNLGIIGHKENVAYV
jgi:ubiquinone/menaquinone biosynthesis C-methylase UbiE